MLERRLTAWLRPALALLGLAGLLLLGGCGGGSGAPNNPYTPPPPVVPPLIMLPSAVTVYAGTPSTLTVSGGVLPYRAFSSDSSVLPVASSVSSNTIVLAANNVPNATNVNVTVQDAAGTVSAPASVTVTPAPLLSSLVTVTANPNPACPSGSGGNLCSGGTGTATVKVTGNGGAGIKGRTVKFDVVQGSFSIVSTNPAQPLVSTLTVVTDSNGDAIVILSVPADTPTQTGIIRATDVLSGNQVTGSFVIQQITVNGQVLAVLPLGTTTITGPDTLHCSTGVTVTNYIFGGTPPYQVATNFPGAVSLTGVPVTKSGGAFNTVTNGTCFANLTYVITDATGLTIAPGNYPLVTNQPGTTVPTPPPSAFVATPSAITKNNCTPANTFQFILTGGTATYSVVVTSSTSSTSPVLAPQTGIAAGAAVTVSGLTSPSTTVVTAFDKSSPQSSASVTIDCTGTGTVPVPSALAVNPTAYDYTQTTCVNTTSNFAVTGGTPPYNVFFAPPRPGAVITPSTLASSGQGFAVTGMTDAVFITNVTVTDSSVPALQKVVTISCPSSLTPPAPMLVSPSTYTYTAAVCNNPSTLSNFVVTGGTPPYAAFFSVPSTVGVISPTTIPTSGSGFAVKGLSVTSPPQTIQVTVQDSSATPLQKVVTVICTP